MHSDIISGIPLFSELDASGKFVPDAQEQPTAEEAAVVAG